MEQTKNTSSQQHVNNLRLVYEEINRWHRHSENFFWPTCAILLAGTGFAIMEVIDMCGKNWKVIILGVSMIFIWYWFLQYLKDILLKIIYLYNETVKIEKELNIIGGITDLPKQDKNQNLLSDFLPKCVFNLIKNIKPKRFIILMIYITYLVLGLWIFFIMEFIIKNWLHYLCNLC
ncbi:MAG: hypothetical protein JXA16_11915 [Bacteroidales bacterium]|nr:hypothetical protein [Bacteroidales bacterium]